MNLTSNGNPAAIEVSLITLARGEGETSLARGVRRICEAHAGKRERPCEEVVHLPAAPDALQAVFAQAHGSSTPLIVKAFGSELVAMSPRVLEALLYDRACLEAYQKRPEAVTD